MFLKDKNNAKFTRILIVCWFARLFAKLPRPGDSEGGLFGLQVKLPLVTITTSLTAQR